ncbi:aminotransferase class I/II-fold pyridoxal phosphate-dependent enzyme [Candidatus Undinarchaeota archaeon]
MGFEAAKRTENIHYAIRDLVLPAREIEKQGHKVIKMNIGDPNKYDFDTPKEMRDALCEATNNKANSYTESEGYLPLREEVAKYYKNKDVDVSSDDVFVTGGVSEALLFLFGACLNHGDELLVPGPSYPPYISYSKFYGAKPVEYRTIEEEGWEPDVDDIRKSINENTKALVIINPNNPTGAYYGKKKLKEICDIAAENDLFVISDEIYDALVYDEEFVSSGSVCKDIPMIILNGVSKTCFAPGWRVGFSVFRDPNGKLADIEEGFARQGRMRLSSNFPCQMASVDAVKNVDKFAKAEFAKLIERRDFAYKRLNEIDGISCQKPGGAFYIFPKLENVKDDKKFVLDLLKEEHVLFVHGSGFGSKYGSGHLRAVFLPPLETQEEAFNRLERFIQKNYS